MIYDVYFAGMTVRASSWDPKVGLWEGFDPLKYIADHIKAGKTDDSFVFITTTAQETAMDEFLDKYELRNYMSYEMPYFITNGNHPDHGRKLRLRVLQSKKEAA